MSEPLVTYNVENAVAQIGLNRPEQLNAFTPDMLDLLRARILQAEGDGARCILLGAQGRAFSAGADIGGFDREGDPPDLGALLRNHFNPVVESLADVSIPVISTINGAAAGAGVSIALAADIVVAAQSSYLLLAFANIGLVPDAGATWLVARSAGRARTLAMALLGERMSAQQAHEAGLVTFVVPDEDLSSTGKDMAETLARKPTLALGMIRRQVGAALSGTLTDALSSEAKNQQAAGRSADFREGVAAFVERRPPNFAGR